MAETFKELNERMSRCDADYQAELIRVYGSNAGDARYDSRNRATANLEYLRGVYLRAVEDWNEAHRLALAS